MEVTIGGNRLGSGNKMQTELHHYSRSTHNLSKKFASSMAVGTLVPCYVNIGLPGDTWEINIDSLVRTLPTNGPLFGSFKMQVDMFMVPIRLYQGILHNNAVNIGMSMNQVFFPVLELYSTNTKSYERDAQVNYSALLRYLGISGGKIYVNGGSSNTIQTEFNAVPALAYYDIYKNYYANKQEKKGYIVSADPLQNQIKSAYINSFLGTGKLIWEKGGGHTFTIDEVRFGVYFKGSKFPTALQITIGSNTYTAEELVETGLATFKYDLHGNGFYLYPSNEWVGKNVKWDNNPNSTRDKIKLISFDLSNIDKMRQYCLSKNQLGQKIRIKEFLTENNFVEPYNSISYADDWNSRTMNGLAVKTYQSDIFNNWLNTEWITGENSIQALTSIDTTSGNFNIDTLNLAQKLYNLFNRIAVSGGTFNDWRDAVYADGKRLIESPIYCGGLSTEIGFEEVVGTAQTDSNGAVNHLGTLAGKGTQVGKKGGYVKIKCDEPCVIMGIASITPRIMYSNGNKWFNTELKTMDDLHKPALDGIGFQDLITEQMDWREHHFNVEQKKDERFSAGKLPAWINYMTDYDECYGDFADPKKCGFMVLGRNYEISSTTKRISDLTTYIDPEKFNYAFADASLAAQNFWVQIGMDIKARRLISAKVIPSI